MNTATKLASYGAVLGAVFGSALAVGAAAGPVDVGTKSHDQATSAEPDMDSLHVGDAAPRQGVSIAAAGFRFEPLTVEVPADTVAAFRFRIVDEAGKAVHRFELNHERELHLIAAFTVAVESNASHSEPTPRDTHGGH